MEFRFVAYDPKTDKRLYQLPRANSVQIGDTFGTRGTLELKYSAKAIDARDLPTFLKVQAEVTFDNGHTWAEVGPSLLRLSGEHEDTDQAGMRTLRFVGREWILDKARVGTGELELIDGKRPFYQSSPGRIIRTLILEAQDRGAAQGINLGNFTTDRDAAGNLWPKVATIYYSPGLPIASVLENLVEQGMCDYRMDGDTLNLYAPETAMGRDLTDRANPVRVHSAVTEAPVKYSLEDLASSALLIGDEGFELEVDNPSAPDDYGRLEVTIEQGGVSDPGTARIMVDEALQRGSREIKEITRTQSSSGAAFLPYRDYRVGDYVQVLEDGQWQKYRVRELQLTRDGQDWTIHAVINDRLQELLLKLAKRTNGIVNGTKGSGGDGTRPTPPENPGIEPAAPEGLIIDQMVYLDRQGIARGQITAGWGAVTESTKGQAVEIGGYELWTRRNETRASWVRVASTDGDLTATHSPVVLSDADGNALEYQWRVRAIAQASNRPGPWSNTVTLTMTQDTTPPPPPSLPTVETDLRVITVDWDGLDEDGEQMPVDFNHVRVYFAVAEDMAGAEQVGYLTQTGTWNSGSMPADVPVWVAVCAVDHVDNESAMTPAQSVTPQKLVDDDSIRDAVTGIDDKINNAVDDLNEAIDNIVIDANGTTTYWMPTGPDETTDPKPKRGDLWFDTSEEGKNELHRFDGDEWVSAADGRIDTIRDAQDDLEADVDRVRTSVDGKNAITQSTSTPPNQYSGSVGDIWEIMSSMGSGGRSVSRWRWNGTVWVSNLIGDTVLGNVDAAKIGTGYLSSDRIESQSITADKLLIGGGSELMNDPYFDQADTTWTPARTDQWGSGPGSGYFPKAALPGHELGYVLAPKAAQSNMNLYGPEIQHGYRIPVFPGETYTASFWAYATEPVTGTTNAGGNYDGFNLQIYSFETQTSGELSSSLRSFPAAYIGDFPGGEWVEISGQFTVNEGVNFVAPRVTVYFPNDAPERTGDIYIGRVSVRQSVGATLIEDGAITTDKIAAGAITADSAIIESINAAVITTGQMSGDRIEANTITADKLLVGAAGNLVPFTPGSGVVPYSDYGSGVSIRAIQHETGGPGYVFIGGNGTDGDLAIAGLLTETLTAENGQSGALTVTPGETISARAKLGLSGWGGNNSGGADVKAARIRTAQYDQGGEYITGTIAYGNTVKDLPFYDGPWSELQVEVDDSAHSMRVWLEKAIWSSGSIFMGDLQVRNAAGATLIEDGAITTDKILANAITAGKIAALAIEADHISANAITADKIKAGAIDGKLITGARIRTAASGRRTELDVEGLRSYDSSGNTVLTTQTSDGSIDMRGYLRQVSKGVEIEVGSNYRGGYPSIQWSDSTPWSYPPGVTYHQVDGNTSKRETFIQGPGVDDGNAYLGLQERGERFYLRTWQGNGSARKSWVVDGNMASNYMTIGNSDGPGPYVYMQRGTGSDGQFWAGYQHPSNGGYSTLALKDRYIWLGAYDSNGNIVSRLWGDADSTALTAGTRDLSLFGRDIFHTADRDIVLNAKGTGIYTPGIPEAGEYAHLVRSNGVISWLRSSRRYKIAEEPIESTVESFEDKLLSVDPKTWYPKQVAEKYADYLTATTNGDEPDQEIDKIGRVKRLAGLMAEDLDEAGLGIFVTYDDEGNPDAVMYDGIAPALIPIIRRLRDRERDLERRVDALEQQLGATA